MSGYRLDAPAGRWIDRERAFVFRCGHRDVPAFAGDTVASALLAAGFTTVARSVKLHRPRGVFSCGGEEPNALFDVGSGAARTPNTRATDMDAAPGLTAVAGNAWPSPRFDLAAINDRLAALLPAGFYYKTFMWPHWHLFEPAIRALAGLGHAAPAASGVDPDRYDEVSKQIDVLVVGGGAAGMAAALAAAQTGRSVLLVAQHAPDDRIWTGRVPATISLSRIASFVEGQFVLDGAALVSLVAEADEVAEQRSLLPTDPEVKKRVVRQQVKAEIKGHLQDDVLVAARKTFGSTRKAAAELTKQLGRPVSKDQVQRAIDRSGGLEALIDQDDSGSVDRRVASQSRDRAKKISQRR